MVEGSDVTFSVTLAFFRSVETELLLCQDLNEVRYYEGLVPAPLSVFSSVAVYICPLTCWYWTILGLSLSSANRE
eukprot:36067-Eustigmatos_ZCMA.PRE.1